MTERLPEIFDYHGRQIRVVTDDNGDPWWVAADVCAVLGIANPSSSLANLDEDERGLRSMETPSGVQPMAVVSEAGLYSLVLRSRKPEARAFKRWVTHEVLPAIRKQGAYLTPETLADPANLIRILQNWQADRERAQRAEVAAAAAQRELEAAQPKAEAWDAWLAEVRGDVTVGEAANMLVSEVALRTGIKLNLGQNRLFERMVRERWLFVRYDGRGKRSYRPRQEFTTAGDGRGYVTYRVETLRSGGAAFLHHRIGLTPKGLEAMRRILMADLGDDVQGEVLDLFHSAA